MSAGPSTGSTFLSVGVTNRLIASSASPSPAAAAALRLSLRRLGLGRPVAFGRRAAAGHLALEVARELVEHPLRDPLHRAAPELRHAPAHLEVGLHPDPAARVAGLLDLGRDLGLG